MAAFAHDMGRHIKRRYLMSKKGVDLMTKVTEAMEKAHKALQELVLDPKHDEQDLTMMRLVEGLQMTAKRTIAMNTPKEGK